MLAADTLDLVDGEVGRTAARIAADKLALSPVTAFVRGILCNALVCLAVDAFALRPGELFWGESLGNIVTARRFAWYVLYMRWRYSYPELAERWGYDQSTIRDGVLAMCDCLKFDRDLQSKGRALDV